MPLLNWKVVVGQSEPANITGMVTIWGPGPMVTFMKPDPVSIPIAIALEFAGHRPGSLSVGAKVSVIVRSSVIAMLVAG